MSLEIIEKFNKNNCNCKKEHTFESKIIIEDDAIEKLPQILDDFNSKNAYVIADINTYEVAGKTVCNLLKNNNINVSEYIFSDKELEPDEASIGLAILNYDSKNDVIIGVGSGVINDISKIVATVTNKPYIIVATAPSMDGYASASSSLAVKGHKITHPSKCPEVIIGDTKILCNAPVKMMLSGIGDMVAKYTALCEWKLSSLINGEYYCPEIANLVKVALKKCIDNADGLPKRDKNAVIAVFEGLILSGVAMKYAGCSRPASGTEHYISHICDMRGIAFGTRVEFHGLQCAVGTLIALKLYKKLKKITPDKNKALAFVNEFDYSLWSEELKKLLDKGADKMIELEKKEQKYDLQKHSKRLEYIINNWDKIIQIIDEELPLYEDMEEMFKKLGIPTTLYELGVDEENLPMIFKSTKDIRDKYILSNICWDLGILDEILD